MTQKERLHLLLEIIKEDDFDRVEGAREIVEKEDLPYLIKYYNTLSNWDEKYSLIEIIQDHYHKDMQAIMLDYLRAPYDNGDSVEFAKISALSFLGEEYDKFDIYCNNRVLLRKDVNKILIVHGLKLVASETEPEEKSVVETTNALYKKELSINHKLANEVYKGNLAQVKEALSKGGNLNFVIDKGNLDGMSMLMCALCEKNYDIARYLIEKGANINYKRGHSPNNTKGQTALSWAAYYNATEIIRLLLEKGALVNTSDHHGSTPLTNAASNGSFDVLKILVAHGADIEAKIYDKRKAINLAANNGYANIVDFLIKQGTNSDYRGDSGYTPLMLAAENGNQKLIKVLINNGANVNAIHNGNSMYSAYKGMTPLAFTVSKGFVKASKLLIEAGADVNYTIPSKVYNNEKRPPQRIIELAKGSRAESIRKLLLSYGAIDIG